MLLCAEGTPNTLPSPCLALHTRWGPFVTTRGDFLNKSSSRDPWSPGTVGLGFSMAPCKLVANLCVFGVQYSKGWSEAWGHAVYFRPCWW